MKHFILFLIGKSHNSVFSHINLIKFFSSCSSLQFINVSAENMSYYGDTNGIFIAKISLICNSIHIYWRLCILLLFHIEKHHNSEFNHINLYQYEFSSELGTIIIGAKSIQYYTFYNCSSLRNTTTSS